MQEYSQSNYLCGRNVFNMITDQLWMFLVLDFKNFHRSWYWKFSRSMCHKPFWLKKSVYPELVGWPQANFFTLQETVGGMQPKADRIENPAPKHSRPDQKERKQLFVLANKGFANFRIFFFSRMVVSHLSTKYLLLKARTVFWFSVQFVNGNP